MKTEFHELELFFDYNRQKYYVKLSGQEFEVISHEFDIKRYGTLFLEKAKVVFK